MFFVNDTIGWFTDQSVTNGEFLMQKTLSEGWFVQETGFDTIGTPLSVYFTNENIGWYGTSGDFICKTEDGGLTWELQYYYDNEDLSIPNNDIVDIFMLNENSGWAINRCTIFRYQKEISVEEIDKEDGYFSVFPNPCSDKIT